MTSFSFLTLSVHPHETQKTRSKHYRGLIKVQEWTPRSESSQKTMCSSVSLCHRQDGTTCGDSTDHPSPSLGRTSATRDKQGEGLLFLGTDLTPPSPYPWPSYLLLIRNTGEMSPSYPQDPGAGQARCNSVGRKADPPTYVTQNGSKGTSPIPKAIFQPGEFSQLPVWSVLCQRMVEDDGKVLCLSCPVWSPLVACDEGAPEVWPVRLLLHFIFF